MHFDTTGMRTAGGNNQTRVNTIISVRQPHVTVLQKSKLSIQDPKTFRKKRGNPQQTLQKHNTNIQYMSNASKHSNTKNRTQKMHAHGQCQSPPNTAPNTQNSVL